MNRWAKHHVGMTTDDKHLAAAEMAGVNPLLPPVVWGALFERAAENGDGSFCGFRPEVLAAKFRVAADEVRRVIDAFAALGMVAGDRLVNWAKRQGQAAIDASRAIAAGAVGAGRAIAAAVAPPPQTIGLPMPAPEPARPRSSGAERTARWRANKAVPLFVAAGVVAPPRRAPGAVPGAAPGVTPGVTPPRHRASHRASHPPVTGRHTPRSLRDQTKIFALRARRARAKGDNIVVFGGQEGGADAAPLPADWRPGDEDRRYALEHGYDAAWIECSARLFARHYAQPGTKRYRDWHEAWQCWVDRELAKSGGRPRTAGGTAGYNAVPPAPFDPEESRRKMRETLPPHLRIQIDEDYRRDYEARERAEWDRSAPRGGGFRPVGNCIAAAGGA